MTSERTADAEAVVRWALNHYIPDGFRDEYGNWHKGPLRAERIAALDRLVARNQQLQEALAALLEWAEKDKGGYQFSDPSEEWFAIRDYARAAVRARSETT